MNEKYCPICGMVLFKTNWGNYYCSNHGKIENITTEEKGRELKEGDYIG